MQLDKQIIAAIIGGVFIVIAALISVWSSQDSIIIGDTRIMGGNSLNIESSATSEAVNGKATSNTSVRINGRSYSGGSAQSSFDVSTDSRAENN